MNKVGKFFINGFTYLVQKVLVYDVGLALIVALSFLFTGNVSWLAYSERLVWVSIVIFLIAGTLAFAQMIPGKLILLPYNMRKPENVRRVLKETEDARVGNVAEKRIDVGIQLFLIGLGVFGLSAIVQVFLS